MKPGYSLMHRIGYAVLSVLVGYSVLRTFLSGDRGTPGILWMISGAAFCIVFLYLTFRRGPNSDGALGQGSQIDAESRFSRRRNRIVVGILAASALAVIAIIFVYQDYSLTKIQLAKPNQISAIFSELVRSEKSPAFAQFSFITPGRVGDDEGVDVQLSMENGNPGVDWVLLSPRNIKEKDDFIRFAKDRGFEPKLRAENGVSYLRVEGGDVASFCKAVITELYGVPPDAQISLIVWGFDWGSAPGEENLTQDVVVTQRR